MQQETEDDNGIDGDIVQDTMSACRGGTMVATSAGTIDSWTPMPSPQSADPTITGQKGDAPENLRIDRFFTFSDYGLL